MKIFFEMSKTNLKTNVVTIKRMIVNEQKHDLKMYIAKFAQIFVEHIAKSLLGLIFLLKNTYISYYLMYNFLRYVFHVSSTL